jgi:tripartite-type tricarboxylate transporter receptor subunit TctC
MSRVVARSTVLASALAVLSVLPLGAQDYPSRNITLVVPLAAGTGMDAIARLYGERLGETLGRPVIVENKPGAGMFAATQSVVTAAPDGHTLMVATPTQLAVNPSLYRQLLHDPARDIIPVSHYLLSPFILVVNPSLPVASVPEFIKYVKERPIPLSYSSPAGGGVPHFGVELIKQRFGLEAIHVPYRNSPQSIQDVAAGHVHFAFAEAGASRTLIQEGKLRALAVSTKQRLPAYPDLPPFAEAAGMPEFDIVAWHILVARAGTPQPIVERLNTEMKRIMGAADMQERIATMGLVPLDPPPVAETERFIKSEAAKWSQILSRIGLAGSM